MKLQFFIILEQVRSKFSQNISDNCQPRSNCYSYKVMDMDEKGQYDIFQNLKVKGKKICIHYFSSQKIKYFRTKWQNFL